MPDCYKYPAKRRQPPIMTRILSIRHTNSSILDNYSRYYYMVELSIVLHYLAVSNTPKAFSCAFYTTMPIELVGILSHERREGCVHAHASRVMATHCNSSHTRNTSRCMSCNKHYVNLGHLLGSMELFQGGPMKKDIGGGVLSR